MLPVGTVELLIGRTLNSSDIELGIAIDELTVIEPGKYGSTKPENVPSTWSYNGKFIPLKDEDGNANDPNAPA